MNLLERAGQAMAAGRAADAVTMIETEMARGAGGPSLHAMLGYAYYHAERIADARDTLARALKLFPYDASLNEANARMLWLSGDAEHFADGFIAAVAQRPGDLPLRVKCAELLRLAGRIDAAEKLLREALAREPGNASIEAWFGVLLDEIGRFDEAETMLRHAAAVFPGEAMLQLNLAHVLLRMGRAREALDVITRVRDRFPDFNLATTFYGMALKALGDPKHDWLLDYQRHVQVYELSPPKGFATIADFNAELGARLRKLQDTAAHPLEQSPRGGTQTSHNLIFDQDPILRAYFNVLAEPIHAYIAAMGDDRDHPLTRRKTGGYHLNGCWSVLLRPNGFHVNHTHPNGWISSSYYISLPPSVGETTQEGWIKFGEPRWPIPGCGIERAVQPKEGRLVLFPSYMWHGTIPFPSGERLTAPFDVEPV